MNKLFGPPPLWMPEGSLRGLALLITVVNLNLMWFLGKTISDQQILIAGGIIGGYFTLRTFGGPKDSLSK